MGAAIHAPITRGSSKVDGSHLSADGPGMPRRLLFVAAGSAAAARPKCTRRSTPPHRHPAFVITKMMSSSDPATSDTPFQPVSAQVTKLQRQYQQLLDKITPFVLYRWLGSAGLLSIFILRIVLSQGVRIILLHN